MLLLKLLKLCILHICHLPCQGKDNRAKECDSVRKFLSVWNSIFISGDFCINIELKINVLGCDDVLIGSELPTFWRRLPLYLLHRQVE